ncbi:uncharacterized protein LY89DRAFT_608715 [Mollisia scopiformis]|uniref:DUF676 domain-containing protein n=1 Tax=Mollisia scopiformis TaxID=149040 RepID=A0A194XP57_MOLSC|nr:uncharacterized protein LY89DRAFT_608715 [Mollisia scopiformis]KUJ22030.1 hypothetical protein LY89DRAFT_608715 [Mollisia scopiformis]
MKKTLLLCFIHGFKGGDDTFGGFPEHLRALVSHALPKVDVQAIVYPKFETRGDLAECVSRFRDWLLEKVIDIEVSRHTPSPTIDPSVHTILIGHSMGGIVAADTILALTSDRAVTSSRPTSSHSTTQPEGQAPAPPPKPELNTLMFPYIRGVLAFDTPYLGISPGVVAHGAEGHYNAASSLFTEFSGLSSAIWGSKATTSSEAKEEKKPIAALPAPPSVEATSSSWGKWGRIAAIAGTGIAVAAGGTAAYLNREQISQGWSWASSHLEFIGCLARPEELKKRVAGIVTLNRELGTGWGNLYTRLGQKAVSKSDGTTLVGSVIGNTRTFCNLPVGKSEARPFWQEAINDAARDEAGAHMTMFYPKDNPGYYAMSEQAKTLIVQWTMDEWYESSTGETVQFAIENEL